MAATKKVSPVKKTPAKKPAAKNKAASAGKKPTVTKLQSFRLTPATEPFFSFRFTRQTVYWLILSIVIVGLVVWVVQLNARVQAIYDQIDQNDITLQNPATKKAPSTTKKPTGY